MSAGFDYSFSTHYAQRVVGRGKLAVIHVQQTKTTQDRGLRYPDPKALCGVVSGPYVGGSHVPNCRKCVAVLRQLERTGAEGSNSARQGVAAAEFLARFEVQR